MLKLTEEEDDDEEEEMEGGRTNGRTDTQYMMGRGRRRKERDGGPYGLAALTHTQEGKEEEREGACLSDSEDSRIMPPSLPSSLSSLLLWRALILPLFTAQVNIDECHDERVGEAPLVLHFSTTFEGLCKFQIWVIRRRRRRPPAAPAPPPGNKNLRATRISPRKSLSKQCVDE